jgi:D-sedoheptulose 7-phosphate isomerase
MRQGDDAFLSEYFTTMRQLASPSLEQFDRIKRTRDIWLRAKDTGGKVIFIGNGGSAAISSHLAIDLAKNAGVPATCFSDSALITCLANDYGHENWMASALRLHGSQGDCLVAISSSGNSQNVRNAVTAARTMELSTVTLSGMSPNNPLRGTGDVNFWVDSRSYNLIETMHQFLMMSVIDLIIGAAEYPAS